MSALKDHYSPAFYERLASVLDTVLTGFDAREFLSNIHTEAFADMELKQRMRHTTTILHASMPASFPDAVPYLNLIIEEYRRQGAGGALVFIFLPDYIEQYGLDHYDEAVKALENVTRFITCEYAVRPFLIKYYEKMMQQMLLWASDHDAAVRRLASEGSRPRLPWAMIVPQLKNNPSDILPILNKLKNDPSEIVRRSVANNLNDISKDHPEIVLDIASQWTGESPEVDAVIRHACRGLLKKGHAGILAHYGLDPAGLVVSDFKLHTPTVAIGDSVVFSFVIENASRKEKMVRLEYGIYYLKANGALARKVFKISERIMKPGEKQYVERKQSFRVITTRVFYPGQHQVSLIINGIEQTVPIHSFELL